MRIDHAAIYVRDLEDARDFFIKYFNASANDLYHNPRTDFRSYFLSFDGGIRLEIMSAPELSDADGNYPRIGFHHLAFSVGSKDAVNTLTQQLESDGYRVISGPRTTGDGYYESCVEVIENILIEITI